jgi:prephenate dehydrogenase
MEQIGGSTYRVLLTLVESVISEDPELYASLQMNLPKVTEAEDLFQKSSKIWSDMVRNRNRQDFVRKMTSLKERFEKSDPDFGQAYQNMYRLLEK